MTNVSDTVFVRAPLSSAARLLSQFFDANATADGLGAHVLLTAGDIQQPAVIAMTPVHRPADMTPHYLVHWEADGGGPFPAFDGELVVGSDEDYNTFVLRLDGRYAPPGGAAGRVFDAVIGRHLAESTVRTLLQQIAATIESHFNREESLKHVHPAV